MEQHTPGPWRTVVDGTGSGRWIAVIADDFEYDDGSPHELLRTETVEVNRNGRWVDTEDAGAIRANARLIAAAPALLEVAEEALASHYTQYPPKWEGDLGYHFAREYCEDACSCGGERLVIAIRAARAEAVAS